MLLAGHYQNAYVTRDLTTAMALVGERFGLSDWIEFALDVPVTTPEGPREMGIRAAVAWAGGLQIELIEPVSGWLDPLLPWLPPDASDPTPRFHHAALRRESLAELDATVARLGLPVVAAGGVPDLQFCYLDARPTLGHYLELVWASAEGWRMVGWPEGQGHQRELARASA